MKKSILFQGRSIVYQASGNGPALVLLHGFLESKAIWDSFTEILQKQFTVIAIDLPGHGESQIVESKHSMQLMADAVKAVLRNENISKAVLTGHSMGGYVALQFAVENETMLKGLVLFHSHANADTDEARENRNRTIDIVNQNRASFIFHFIPDLFDQNHVSEYTAEITRLQGIAALMMPDAIIAALAGMRDRTGQQPYLLQSKIPVLSILGKQDSRMPYKQLIPQALIPSHCEILLLENVGHMGFIEAADKTLWALQHFAARCFKG